jgi:hypothetical protein
MTVRYARLLAAAATGAVVVAGMPAVHAADPTGPDAAVTLAAGPSAVSLDYIPIAHTSRGTVFETVSGGALLVSDTGTATTFNLASGYHTSACTDMFVSEPPLTTDPLTWTNVVTGVTGETAVHSGRFFLGATPDGWLETVLNETSTPAATEVHKIVATTGADTLIASVTDPSDETSAPSLSEQAYVCDAFGYAVTAYGASQTSLLLGSFAGGTPAILDSVTESSHDLYPLTVSGDSAVYGIDVFGSGTQLISSTTMRTQVGHGRTTLRTAGIATAAAIGSGGTAYSVVDLATSATSLYVRSDAGAEVRPSQPGTLQPGLIWPQALAPGVAASGTYVIAASGTSGGALYTATADAVHTPAVWPSGGGDPIKPPAYVPLAYVPLAPTRLLDTRTAIGGHHGQVAARHAIDVTVTGGSIPTDASAVVLNVTATQPLAAGYVSVYPTGASLPTASNLNYAKGQTIANQVLAKVGSGGMVRLYTDAAAHLVVDLAGYYPAGATYTALDAPTRIVDTRSGVGAPRQRVGDGSTLGVTVTGGSVPAAASAVVLNVTATGSSTAGYLTVYPHGVSRPTASNINYAKGQTIAGMVVAKVGTSGQVDIFANRATHVVVDVQGWVATDGDYHPLGSPVRFLDTREITGGHHGQVVGRQAVSLKVTGYGVDPAAQAVMLNVTATGMTKAGYVTVYPAGTSRPTASNLNYGPGATIANSVVAKVGANGSVTLYVDAATHLVVDVSGYWLK